jgi:hypothetical protein
LRSQVVRQAHERGHFWIANIMALINQECCIPNVRDKMQKFIRNFISLAEKNRVDRRDFWIQFRR